MCRVWCHQACQRRTLLPYVNMASVVTDEVHFVVVHIQQHLHCGHMHATFLSYDLLIRGRTCLKVQADPQCQSSPSCVSSTAQQGQLAS